MGRSEASRRWSSKEIALEQLKTKIFECLDFAQRLYSDANWLNVEIAKVAKCVSGDFLLCNVAIHPAHQADAELHKIRLKLREQIKAGSRWAKIIEGGKKAGGSIFPEGADCAVCIQPLRIAALEDDPV